VLSYLSKVLFLFLNVIVSVTASSSCLWSQQRLNVPVQLLVVLQRRKHDLLRDLEEQLGPEDHRHQARDVVHDYVLKLKSTPMWSLAQASSCFCLLRTTYFTGCIYSSISLCSCVNALTCLASNKVGCTSRPGGPTRAGFSPPSLAAFLGSPRFVVIGRPVHDGTWSWPSSTTRSKWRTHARSWRSMPTRATSRGWARSTTRFRPRVKHGNPVVYDFIASSVFMYEYESLFQRGSIITV
jgi:hypothetical protein